MLESSTPIRCRALIAPGSIPRSLLRTFNFEIWKLKCLGACPEDLYSVAELFTKQKVGSSNNGTGEQRKSGL